MASSSYSATPAPPARIRVVSHEPLPVFRAWLPLPASTPSGQPGTVRELVQVVRGMLAGRPEVEVELQGFTLLLDSPLSMLDPANDILDIKAVSPSTFVPQPVLTAAAAQIPLPPSPKAQACRSASPSSSSSSSSSSSDSDSDVAPEVLSTKRPLTNGHHSILPNGDVRPTKRPRTASPAAASSSSSSSSSSDSSSDSSSSDSDSDSDSSAPPTAANGTAKAQKAAKATTSGVAPGQGRVRTKKRNLRKRTVRSAKAKEKAIAREADLALKATKEEESPVVSVSAEVKPVDEGEGEQAMELDDDESVSPPPAFLPKTLSAASTPIPLPIPPAPSTSATASIQVAAPPFRPSPTSFLTGGEPGKSLVGAGHAALLSTLPARKGGKKKNKQQQKQQETPRFFAQPQPAQNGGRAALPIDDRDGKGGASPEYRPMSPDLSYSSLSPPSPAPVVAPVETPVKGKKQPPAAASTPRPAAFTNPAKRRDLPPNMVITSVNVEAKGWQPGVRKVARGTSKKWVAASVKEAAVVGAVVEVTEEVAKDDGRELSGEEIEEKWDRLRSATKETVKEGAKVAVKVLELDPTTFAPSLSLKIGILLPPTPSSSLRIQLNPSCLPSAVDDEEYDEGPYGEEEEEVGFYGAALRKKLRFGEDLGLLETEEDEGKEGEGVWEGEWEGTDVRMIQ